MGHITKDDIILVCGILNRWTGCEVKATECDGSVADSLQRRQGWLAFKDSNGLVNWVAFSDAGLIPHAEAVAH